MTKYIVKDETGKVYGTRKSDRTYTHAVVVEGHANSAYKMEPGVLAYCGRPDLAAKKVSEATGRNYLGVRVVPVQVA